jgi:hypothetical protein
MHLNLAALQRMLAIRYECTAMRTKVNVKADSEGWLRIVEVGFHEQHCATFKE